MFVEQHYNSNISHKRYFRADQREAAIAEAERIATRRGDTNDVPIRPHGMIEVVLAEAVRLAPHNDHGDGDPFINQIQGITERSGSAGEAAIGTLLAFAQSTLR